MLKGRSAVEFYNLGIPQGKDISYEQFLNVIRSLLANSGISDFCRNICKGGCCMGVCKDRCEQVPITCSLYLCGSLYSLLETDTDGIPLRLRAVNSNFNTWMYKIIGKKDKETLGKFNCSGYNPWINCYLKEKLLPVSLLNPLQGMPRHLVRMTCSELAAVTSLYCNKFRNRLNF